MAANTLDLGLSGLQAGTTLADPRQAAIQKILALMRLGITGGSYFGGNGQILGAGAGGMDILGGILRALSEGASARQKVGGGLQAARGATQAGAALGAPGAAKALPYVGPAASAAGLGLSLADIAKSDAPNREKAGASAKTAFDAVFSILVPVYGVAKTVQLLGQHFQRSGSPQVRGLGTTLDYMVEPGGAKAFWELNSGKKGMNMKRAAEAGGGAEGFVLDLMGPLGAIARGTGKGHQVAEKVMDWGPIAGGGTVAKMLGMNKKPTHGTIFRNQFNQIAGQMPELKGLVDMQSGGSKMTPEQYNAYSPESRDAANRLGILLAGLAPEKSHAPVPYELQASQALLQGLGEGIIPVAQKYQTEWGVDPRLMDTRLRQQAAILKMMGERNASPA